MRSIAVVAAFCLLPLSTDASQAAVRRVPLDFPTITAALAAAVPGDSLRVAAGTYSPVTNGETFPLQMATNNIRLLGAGMDATVLDARGSGSVIRCSATIGGRVSGFRITGGSGSQGGGIDIIAGNVEVDHNRIDHNGASVGGAGISARNASVTWIHHNLILDNFATTTTDVHGVRLNQTVTGVFENNVVAHTDGNGLLTVESAAPSVRHNIFYQNGIPSPVRGRGICWLSNAPATIFHNLFFQNQVAALLWASGGGDFSGTAANAFDPADSVYGNIDLDPLFVDAAAGDFHLMAGSPAIDAGDPLLPRDPDGTIADLGPFAYSQIVSSVPPAAGGELTCNVSPNPLRVSADVRCSLGKRARVRVDVVDLSGRIVCTLDDGLREPGAYALRWNGTDGGGRALIPGLYYVRMRSGTRGRVVPVVVIR